MFIHCSSAPTMLTCLNHWPWHLAYLRCAPGKQYVIVAPALHSYSMGGSVSMKLWHFHHPFLLLPDTDFAFWSGANESWFIASLAECKISRREEIGKIPSLAQGSVVSLLPVSSTERCHCLPCNWAVCQGMLPLWHSTVPGSLGSKGSSGDHWGHYRLPSQVTVSYLPAISHFKGIIFSASFPLTWWVSELPWVACSGPSPNFQSKYICDQIRSVWSCICSLLIAP